MDVPKNSGVLSFSVARICKHSVELSESSISWFTSHTISNWRRVWCMTIWSIFLVLPTSRMNPLKRVYSRPMMCTNQIRRSMTMQFANFERSFCRHHHVSSFLHLSYWWRPVMRRSRRIDYDMNTWKRELMNNNEQLNRRQPTTSMEVPSCAILKKSPKTRRKCLKKRRIKRYLRPSSPKCRTNGE